MAASVASRRVRYLRDGLVTARDCAVSWRVTTDDTPREHQSRGAKNRALTMYSVGDEGSDSASFLFSLRLDPIMCDGRPASRQFQYRSGDSGSLSHIVANLSPCQRQSTRTCGNGVSG